MTTLIFVLHSVTTNKPNLCTRIIQSIIIPLPLGKVTGTSRFCVCFDLLFKELVHILTLVYVCVCVYFRPSFRRKKGNNLWIFLPHLGRAFLSFPIANKATGLSSYLWVYHLQSCAVPCIPFTCVRSCHLQKSGCSKKSLAVASNLEWNFSCKLNHGQWWTSK